MFWNDIDEIKEWMNRLTERLTRIDRNVETVLGIIQENNSCTDRLGRDIAEVIKDSLIDILDSEDEYNLIGKVHLQLEELQRVLIAERTLDKFEDYMKNVDKVNALINEFKGCVALARASVEERKQVAKDEQETVDLIAKIAEKLHKCEEKVIKKGKFVKKKAGPKVMIVPDLVCE